MPVAYSYIRFSQISQSKGGSLERQSMTAQEYVEKEGLTLDTKLKMRDLGVSGFRGKNAREGALSEFLKAVEAKQVAAGSYLLIEDMDRLTRLPVMKALAVFQQILAGGVIVVTLKNGQKYSEETLANDWTQLMPVLFDMSRGNAESERKSYLLGKAWRKKKEDAAKLKPMGNVAPMWLEYVKDEKTGEVGYRKIKERVDIVNRIFQLSIDGYGHGAITAMLNKEGVPAFRGNLKRQTTTWGVTSVARLLGNRAVLGEYQPWSTAGDLTKRTKAGDAVPDYFPQIVTPDLFNRAQDAIESRYISRSTKQSKIYNVWAGVAVCSGCGAAMTVVKKGVSRVKPAVEGAPPVDLTYYVCSNSQKGLCDETGVRLDASEKVFRVILATTGNMSLVEDDVAKQESQLQATRGRLIAEQTKMDSLVKALDDSPSMAGANLLSKQEQRVMATKEEIGKLEALLAANTVIDRQSFFDRIDLVTRAGRNQANALLKRLGIKVAINKAGRRSKLSHYAVYQYDRLILRLRDNAGEITPDSYSSNITWRLLAQKVVTEDDMEVKATLQRKFKPRKPVGDAAVREGSGASSGPDWASHEGDRLPHEAYDLLDDEGKPQFSSDTYRDEYSIPDENGNFPRYDDEDNVLHDPGDE
jgi:hypothetical protein